MLVAPSIVIESVENLFLSVSAEKSNDLVPCSVLIRLRIFMPILMPLSKLFNHPLNLLKTTVYRDQAWVVRDI